MAGEGRTAILKGLQEGRDVESLFLQVAEVIGRLTGDGDFPRRVREELLTVCGVGLAEEVPCRMEREAVTDRLRRLTAAEQSAAEENDRRRIRRAIAAHRAALARLKDTAGAE